MRIVAASVLLSALAWLPSSAAVYEVGPGKQFTSIGAAPWATLQAGDTVKIYYRPDPYREKWVICRQGTAAAPITVTGVPGPGGELPVIDGANAVTGAGLNYWSEVRGILKIGGANVPADTMPRYIIVENLDIRGARAANTFVDRFGATQNYQSNASSIYIEKCEFCTIRNNILHDSGNALFVASSSVGVSRNILVQRNYIYDGGNPSSIFEHNIYTAAIGIVFEGNRLGRLIAGAQGNNLKDRSAGTVIRYNWIEGGNRQIDLVDGEDTSLIPADPGYSASHVYGNVLYEYDADGNRQMVHYGGDSGTTSQYRKGTLHLYNNTFISVRTDRTTLVRLSTNEETVDARNNIFYTTAAGTTISLGDASGIYYLSHNWIKPGWVNSFGPFSGSVNNDGTNVNGASPGFVDEAGRDYHLTSSSACVNAGGNLNAAVLPAHNVVEQYVQHQSTEPRPVNGLFDIGAYEFGGGGTGNQPPVAAFTATPTSGYVPLTVSFSATGSFDPDGTIASYAWDFGDGGTGSGVAPTFTYNATGVFTALLRVTDNAGATASLTRTITVNGLPAPVLSGSVSGSTVNLNWTNAAGSAVTGFRVERKQRGNSQWVFVGNVTGTSFTETRPRGSWSYRVRGFNSAAVSPYSNTVSLKVR